MTAFRHVQHVNSKLNQHENIIVTITKDQYSLEIGFSERLTHMLKIPYHNKKYSLLCLFLLIGTLSFQFVIGPHGSIAKADSIAVRVGGITNGSVNSMAQTIDGRFVYVATSDNVIKKFNIETRSLIASIPAFNAGGLSVTPDGLSLLAYSASTNQINHPIDQLLKISTVDDQIISTYSTAAWPVDPSATVNLQKPIVTPDGSHVILPYNLCFDNVVTGGRSCNGIEIAKLDLANDVMTVVSLPSELGSNPYPLRMSSDGSSLYVAWQQGGSRSNISRVSLETNQVVWTQPASFFTWIKDLIEGTDGYAYVLGENLSITHIIRYNLVTGIRDTQFHYERFGSSSDNLFLVDDGWGLRFFVKELYSGEFGYQRRTYSQHLHLTNLQTTGSQVLDNFGETYGFTTNGDVSTFYNSEPGWSASIYAVQLEDAPQTISINSFTQQVLGVDSPTLTGSASSGMPLTFISTTPSVCSISETRVTGLTTGTCGVRASQSGGKGWKSVYSDINFSFRKPVISWGNLANDLKRSLTRTVSASSDSGLRVTFASQTPTTCEVSGSTITYITSGECGIVASQAASGSIPAAESLIQRFTIFPSASVSGVGVSINGGDAYTNEAKVVLNVAWPDYATEVNISNDGGFKPTKTSNFVVNDEVNWSLDDSVKGSFTKVIYLRFIGPGVDSTRIYSDDIILDTTPPVLTSVTGVSSQPSSSSVSISSLWSRQPASGAKLTIRAKDLLSGIGQVQVKTSVKGNFTIVQSSNPKASSRTIRVNTKKKRLYVRVVDQAGNPSRWLSVSIK